MHDFKGTSAIGLSGSTGLGSIVFRGLRATLPIAMAPFLFAADADFTSPRNPVKIDQKYFPIIIDETVL